MIFSELYSVYYTTVGKILAKALEPDTTEEQLRQIVAENAFSESVLTILPALKSGKWQLLKKDLTSVVKNVPTMPLTTLEKRWLKAISFDPRVRLFDVEFPDLSDVEPLFTGEDYKIFDQYSDGDPYTDENYICNFRLIFSAIKQNRPVRISMKNRRGKRVWVRFFPRGFEYSEKDDKIRIIAEGCKFKRFNLGRVITCEYLNELCDWREVPPEDKVKELVLSITDERNALERVMLHFAHFEKQAEKIDDKHYVLRLKYYESDETEMIIRILSFGPYVKVEEPQEFVELIKERLNMQKSLGCR